MPRLNASDAAASLGIALKTLYNKASAGEIPSYKTGPNGGGLLWFEQADLDAWRASHRRKSNDEIDEEAKDQVARFNLEAVDA